MGEIRLEKVYFSYEQEDIVQDLSLVIPAGTFTIVVGPNGAGKTTLLRLVAGLLSPEEGKVTIDGLSVGEAQRQGLIHLVPQIYNKNASQFPATVYEIVGLGLLVQANVSRHERQQRIEDALHKVGMWELRDRRIGELSGGQQQRVMIAQALARHSKYLLLDEPTSGVDMKASAHIFELLRSLCRQGLTIIMVTHDITEAAKVADEVICVDRHVCYQGDCQGFLESHMGTALSWHIGG
ncbi:metal ABC transporter ATP-binding protein [Veillonella magna]|uniref:metal ABC transporter ATP-binding protein n=1 Tax=Veillonella magna TaxID=464322 RepID=UPI0023F3A212|nr:metal ABC transporter ATP-binding protein [Veillonella magna]MBD8975987.1 metal ABC transporter ATP-binding protein [Veillonella magna]